MAIEQLLTLAVYSSFSSMFLAARSLWMKPFLERYSIASAISRQKLSNCRGNWSSYTAPALGMKVLNSSFMCPCANQNYDSVIAVARDMLNVLPGLDQVIEEISP